jgi:hypothetical protein
VFRVSHIQWVRVTRSSCSNRFDVTVVILIEGTAPIDKIVSCAASLGRPAHLSLVWDAVVRSEIIIDEMFRDLIELRDRPNQAKRSQNV